MRETTAGFLGLGAVALITFALAASLVYNSLILRKRPEAPQGTIGKAFLATQGRATAQTVTGLDRLLPAGMPEGGGAQASCRRGLSPAPSNRMPRPASAPPGPGAPQTSGRYG